MNIFENFQELSREENFIELKLMFDELINKKYVYKKKFDQDMFFERINIGDLEVYQIKEINDFISNRLIIYPNLYPHIVRVHTKNYERDRIHENKKYVKDAKKLLETRKTLEAVDKIMSKKFTKYNIKEASSLFNDSKAKDLYKNIVKFLSKEIVVDDIIDELQIQIENNFSEYLNYDEIRVLTKCIAFEVYFRTKKPSIYCDSFSKIENQYNEFQQVKKYILKEKVNKMLSDHKSEENIIEEISKFLKK